jgi:hypothetical protein
MVIALLFVGKVTGDTGDADFRKSPMKMIYGKLPKTASLPVTCHRLLEIAAKGWNRNGCH